MVSIGRIFMLESPSRSDWEIQGAQVSQAEWCKTEASHEALNLNLVESNILSSNNFVSFAELYEGLKRAQRSRLEDQRGTEINFELPDFLKVLENFFPSHFFFNSSSLVLAERGISLLT